MDPPPPHLPLPSPVGVTVPSGSPGMIFSLDAGTFPVSCLLASIGGGAFIPGPIPILFFRKPPLESQNASVTHRRHTPGGPFGCSAGGRSCRFSRAQPLLELTGTVYEMTSVFFSGQDFGCFFRNFVAWLFLGFFF